MLDVVGEKWTERFLERHPKYHLKVQESMEIRRHKAFQPRILRLWYQKLQEVWEERKSIRLAASTGMKVALRLELGESIKF